MVNIAHRVAPFAGAWIEITKSVVIRHMVRVAPFAGAWIEIILSTGLLNSSRVAPFAGAWIEIDFFFTSWSDTQSLPLRERGLKSCPLRT